jgi:hypothetical protein
MCWLAQRLQGPGADQGTVSFRAGLYFGNVGGNRQFTLVVTVTSEARRVDANISMKHFSPCVFNSRFLPGTRMTDLCGQVLFVFKVATRI